MQPKACLFWGAFLIFVVASLITLLATLDSLYFHLIPTAVPPTITTFVPSKLSTSDPVGGTTITANYTVQSITSQE